MNTFIVIKYLGFSKGMTLYWMKCFDEAVALDTFNNRH